MRKIIVTVITLVASLALAFPAAPASATHTSQCPVPGSPEWEEAQVPGAANGCVEEPVCNGEPGPCPLPPAVYPVPGEPDWVAAQEAGQLSKRVDRKPTKVKKFRAKRVHRR